jgi:acetylornithine deacetylase
LSESRAISILEDLIRFNSVSCFSNREVSEFVADHLKRHQFEVEQVVYSDEHQVDKVNIIAKRGSGPNGIAYSAHTDVVPADDWQEGLEQAFAPKILNDRIYGRGACDMKGSLAAALAAADMIDPSTQNGSIYFVVSADEELGMIGARHIANDSKLYRDMKAARIPIVVGEPTELQVYYAHKGTQRLTILSRGISAHSSTRDGLNANDKLFAILPQLAELKARTESDPQLRNDRFDPPTLSWNWTMRNEPYATNITTALAELHIFIRPMPNVDHSSIVKGVERIVKSAGLEFIEAEQANPLDGDPNSELVQSMLVITGNSIAKTVCYATDACVLQESGPVVICGPGNIAQAHRNDEWISIDQIDRGVKVYRSMFERFAT